MGYFGTRIPPRQLYRCGDLPASPFSTEGWTMDGMFSPRRSGSAVFELQVLESRVFLSVTAPAAADDVAHVAAIEQGATPQAAAPSELLTKAVRQNLLNHWTGPNKQ